jgi:hypothetical protein
MLPPRSAARIISFRSMLPGTALLNMVGLLQDERPHITERRKPGAILEHNRAARFADHPQDVFIREWVRTAVSSVMTWFHRIIASQITSCSASTSVPHSAQASLVCSLPHCPEAHELFTTNPNGRGQRPIRLARGHVFLFRLRPYAALCSDGLSAKIRSLWTAASVHVRASSINACLFPSVFNRKPHAGPPRHIPETNRVLTLPSLLTMPPQPGACAYLRRQSV